MSVCPQLKESKRAVNSLRDIVDDEEDELEKVSWSGEPVGSECRPRGVPRPPPTPAGPCPRCCCWASARGPRAAGCPAVELIARRKRGTC